jgi:hypothetical protein
MACLVIALLAAAVLGAGLCRQNTTTFCLTDNDKGACADDSNFDFYVRSAVR